MSFIKLILLIFGGLIILVLVIKAITKNNNNRGNRESFGKRFTRNLTNCGGCIKKIFKK